MTDFRLLARSEPRARRLLVAHLQSSLGTGAAYVALLLIAVERFDSPFAVSAILLCELLPVMLLGPVLGALADRWSRRALLVGSELLRAGAFLGLALVGSFEATVAFALLAGLGQAAFQPTVMASLPSLVDRDRLPAVTGLYGAIQELGYTVGPLIGAAAFAIVGPHGVLLANAVTFALSAVLVATLPLARAAAGGEAREKRPGLAVAVADGVRALRESPIASVVVLTSTAFVCFLGAVNVAEVLLVRDTLGGGATELSLIVAAMGLGITAGSLFAGRHADNGNLYLTGLVLCGASLLGCAVAPGWEVALAAFFVLGIGNGLALVTENVLLQQVIPDDLKGRVFGLKGALISWAFGVAYFGGGALVAGLGGRQAFVALGSGCLVVWIVARAALRGRTLRAAPVPAPA